MQQFSKANHRQSQMKKVQQQLENWRKNRKSKRTPIPDSLWEAAIGLHGEYSTYEIVKALRLNSRKLKCKILNASEKKAESTPAFIQLDIPGPQPRQSEWSIEMENVDGAKMKISGTGSEMPDIALICQNFLGGKR
ncbi:hypothetical protein KKA13_00265 [Patescibacteria group bacterium]|nr:hypothetical protein [Patescibacteria group bacterium]